MTACGGGGGGGISSNSSYEGAIDLYIKYLTGEASKSEVKRLQPQFFWDMNDETPEEVYEDMKGDPEYPMEMLKNYYGKNVKITYKQKSSPGSRAGFSIISLLQIPHSAGGHW